MKASDKTIVVAIGLVVLIGAFYLLAISPKRERAAELGDEITSLQSSITEQEQVASFAEQARQEFPRYYGRLVVLGKAVPEQADTASMLVELSSIAGRSGVEFRGIELSTGDPSSTDAAAETGAASTTTDGSAPPTDSTASTAAPAPATAAPATEASAASQPIGSAVGPAGLPTLPYLLSFRGGFFGIADYIGGLDSLVQMRGGGELVAANGRLITVDGFALEGGLPGADPALDATFKVTTYVTPEDQGLTAGATPTGPAPATQPDPTITASSGVAQ